MPLAFVLLHTFALVAIYRAAHWLYLHRVPALPNLLHTASLVLFSADMSPAATIGPGFRIAHSVGIVIGEDVRAGRNLQLFPNVTLGGRNRTRDGRSMPTLGDNVSVFSGACVLGPIEVGDDVSIGANSVVLSDVPAKSVVVGAPAKIVGKVDTAHAVLSLRI